jgi:hypothetical protein
MARSVRLMAVSASMLALLSSFVYNIAITRKIPTAGLGLLSLLNASTGFSLLPTAVLSFVYPRITARDGGLNVRASLGVSSIFYLITTAMTIAYLATVWDKMGGYATPLLIISLLSEVTYYLQAVTNSVLMVKDRSRFVISSIMQSLVKFSAVPVIMVLGWSIDAVLWSTFFIVFIPTIYTFIYTLRFHVRIHNMRRYLREAINASWVPLMGYAINSFRSLDAMFIGLLGYAQLGIWYVIFILSKPLNFSRSLVSVTYGELLERDRVGIVYRDFLMVLLISTYIALTLSLFPGVFLNLVRPSLRGEFGLLVLPVLLMVVNSTLNNVNQFISNVMQGVDKRDLASEIIRAKSYVGSLVLRTHLAELSFTITYLTTMVPLILLFQHVGIAYYAVVGALVASLLANVTAILFRLNGLGQVRALLNGKQLVVDYVAPLIPTIIILVVIGHYWVIALMPNIYVTLLQIVEVSLVSLTIYLALSIIISRNIRELMKVMINRVLRNLIII